MPAEKWNKYIIGFVIDIVLGMSIDIVILIVIGMSYLINHLHIIPAMKSIYKQKYMYLCSTSLAL